MATPKRLFTQCILTAAPLFALAWLAGAVLRDRTPLSTLLFYIPTPVFIAGGLLAIVLLARHDRRRTAGIMGCIVAVAMVKMLAVDFSWKVPVESSGQLLRVVHWNVSHGDAGKDRLLRVLKSDEADLYVLSEFPSDAAFATFAEELIPGGSSLTRAAMLVVSTALKER